MERERVESTSVESVGYDPDAQVLEIEFKNGGVYRYLDVPAEVVEAFLGSASLGQFFNDQIREQYSTERVV